MIEDPKYLTHEATSIFIRGDIQKNMPPDLYNLDQEFAKTKKNRNSITILSLIIFTLLFLAAAYGVTKYIEYQNSQIPININAFEDVNLREIFDKAKQYEKEMKSANRDLEDLYIKQESALKELTRIAQDKINLIEAQNLGGKDRQIKLIENQLAEQLKNEEIVWTSKISDAQEKIKIVQDKIDSYDTRILEKAKEQESIINNQQKRFDMEMEESVKYYEDKIQKLKSDQIKQLEIINQANKDIILTLKSNNQALIKSLEEKYNPVFGEDFDFLEANGENVNLPEFSLNAKDQILFNEGLLSLESLNKSIDDFYNVSRVFEKLGEIPYYNSPSDAILYIEKLYYSSIDEFTNFVDRVSPLLTSKNILIENKISEIEQYGYFLQDFVKTNRVNGIIIDPRNRDIKLFVDSMYNIKPQSIGYIYRNDSDFIGTIKFKTVKGRLVGNIEELASSNRGLKPFDKILIDLK